MMTSKVKIMKLHSRKDPDNRIELIVCDGDGTLIDFDGSEFGSSWDFLASICFADDPERWYLWMEVARHYSSRIKDCVSVEEEEIFFRQWAQKDASALKGVDSNPMQKKPIPYAEGAEDYFSMLREKGVEVKKAILSGGLDIVFERVKDELGFDMCISNILGTDQAGRFTGDIELNVTLHNKLMRCVMDIMYSNQMSGGKGISRNNVVFIGNDYNDLTLLELVKRAGGISLAFNPTFSSPENYVNGVIDDFMQIEEYVEIR